MTAEAALAKLSYLFSQDLPVDEIKRLMQTNLRGELTP
jgi:L-asparaginase